MLDELVTALAAEGCDDGWETARIAEVVNGKERPVVAVSRQGRRVVTFWFDSRSDKLHLEFRTESAFTRAPMHEWDEGTATAAAVGAISAIALSDQALKDAVKPRPGQLVPGGTVPRDRFLRELFRRSLKEIRPMGDRNTRPRTELRSALRKGAGVVGDVVIELRDLHQSMPDVKILEAVDKLRQDMRTLVRLGVEFDKIRKVWDEETVRAVQES